MLDRKRRRRAIAGGIPGDYPKSGGQRLQLVPERRGGRSYAVQQDKRRAAASFQKGEGGIPGPHGLGAGIGGAHAA
jgi:hypothetical protein